MQYQLVSRVFIAFELKIKSCFVSRVAIAFELNPGIRRQSTACCGTHVAMLARHPTLGQQLGISPAAQTAAPQARPLFSPQIKI
jgi:hypothetical protein